jgi:hypothetical protein
MCTLKWGVMHMIANPPAGMYISAHGRLCGGAEWSQTIPYEFAGSHGHHRRDIRARGRPRASTRDAEDCVPYTPAHQNEHQN